MREGEGGGEDRGVGATVREGDGGGGRRGRGRCGVYTQYMMRQTSQQSLDTS